MLEALAHHSKPWVRVCTAYYLGEHPARNPSLLLALLADSEGMVRETALWAGWRAYAEAWRPHVHSAEQSSDPALRRAAQRITGTHAEATDQSARSTPMLTVEKVLILESAPLFAGLDSEELAALAEIALEKEFAQGEIIFEEGQSAHHLYVVVQGKVEVFRRADSHEYPVVTLGEEECFGEMSILEDTSRSASVRALEPTRVLKIDRESFRELIIERPQIAFAIFKIISGRLRHMNLEIEHVATIESHRNYA